MKGETRRGSIVRRMRQINPICSNVPQAATSSVVCSGSSTCSHSAVAASAKAKPAVPTAKAPRKTKPRTWRLMPATVAIIRARAVDAIRPGRRTMSRDGWRGAEKRIPWLLISPWGRPYKIAGAITAGHWGEDAPRDSRDRAGRRAGAWRRADHRATISRTPDHHDRAVHGRRPDRRAGARAGAAHEPDPRPADRDRERNRRGGHARLRARRQGGARRLHAGDGKHRHPCGERRALQEPGL